MLVIEWEASYRDDDDDDDDYNNNNNNNNNNNKLHFNICEETGVQLDKNHWYEHVPKSVETSQGGKVIILWNQQVQTDRTIANNKPDIMIRDNGKGICMLIDGRCNLRRQKCD